MGDESSLLGYLIRVFMNNFFSGFLDFLKVFFYIPRIFGISRMLLSVGCLFGCFFSIYLYLWKQWDDAKYFISTAYISLLIAICSISMSTIELLLCIFFFFCYCICLYLYVYRQKEKLLSFLRMIYMCLLALVFIF